MAVVDKRLKVTELDFDNVKKFKNIFKGLNRI